MLSVDMKVKYWQASDLADLLDRIARTQASQQLRPVVLELAEAFYALINDTDVVTIATVPDKGEAS